MLHMAKHHEAVKQVELEPYNNNSDGSLMYECAIISLFKKMTHFTLVDLSRPTELSVPSFFSDMLKNLKHLNYLSLQPDQGLSLEDESFTVSRDLRSVETLLLGPYIKYARNLCSAPASRLRRLELHDYTGEEDDEPGTRASFPWSCLHDLSIDLCGEVGWFIESVQAAAANIAQRLPLRRF
ncbi:hypothetical protein JCM8547_002961 [Rhodosporidiobolus lusitaniae]